VDPRRHTDVDPDCLVNGSGHALGNLLLLVRRDVCGMAARRSVGRPSRQRRGSDVIVAPADVYMQIATPTSPRYPQPRSSRARFKVIHSKTPQGAAAGPLTDDRIIEATACGVEWDYACGPGSET
jgi:hypothetical protein